ncbi:MAG: class I SAM-dependent methyltransferase [Planctomycetota bacterium]
MSLETRPKAIRKLLRRFYPQPRPDPLDALFRRLAKPGMLVLDAGCGGDRGCSREAPWRSMYIVGADADPAVARNPFCNAAVVADLAHLPFGERTFDLIHCRWVLEHLSNPILVFREFARVLRPGGSLLALTPNLFHYATLAAKLTPYRFHRWWHRGEYDPFPTVYRANSRHALMRLNRAAQLIVVDVQLWEGPPVYLMRWAPAFLVGVVYERMVNSWARLGWMRRVLVLHASSSVSE